MGTVCYSDEDFEVMKLDAEILLDNGADGVLLDVWMKEILILFKPNGQYY